MTNTTPRPPSRPRRRHTGAPTYVAPEDQPTYPPEPYWGKDDRGRFRYVDYDGESLVIRFDMNGDLWADKLGEGPVYIRKEHIPVIIAALNGEME